jgi:hypothetical protein
MLNIVQGSWKNEPSMETLLPHFVGKLGEKNSVTMPLVLAEMLAVMSWLECRTFSN